jgi:hypothetical protein
MNDDEQDAADNVNVGNIIQTTKQLAAIRQLEAAISHFWKNEYECAITLAAAAEGILPPPDRPHGFSLLRGSPFFEKVDFNFYINWLKHPLEPQDMLVSEFETAMIIVRAISKLAAFNADGTDEIKAFGRWAFQAGYLPMPNTA